MKSTSTSSKPPEKVENADIRQALWRSIQLVMESAPKELWQIGIFNLVRGVGPSAALYFSKIVIDNE